MEHLANARPSRKPWNKGKIVGQKAPFKPKEIWAIRVRLQLAEHRRELALFNLAIDSKLRACDLVKLRVRDVCHGQAVAARTIVLQQKTQRPVQFEITEPTREAVRAWISHAALTSENSLFPSRLRGSTHLSTRQYARIVDSWVSQLGLDKANYGTHTLRRTKATLIYSRTRDQGRQRRSVCRSRYIQKQELGSVRRARGKPELAIDWGHVDVLQWPDGWRSRGTTLGLGRVKTHSSPRPLYKIAAA